MKTIDNKPRSNFSLLCKHEEQIAYIKADSNYSKVHFIDKSSEIICHTLHQFENALNKDIFFRCHRSYLVNSGYILGIDIKNLNKLLLMNNIYIPISIKMSYELRRSIKCPSQSYLNKQLLKAIVEKLNIY
jgi:hypothetical protein